VENPVSDRIELLGAPGSPYTRKMLALMRYRQIAYKVFWQGNITSNEPAAKYPKAKVGLLPTFYFPDDKGELQALTDSSPILRRFEETHAGRSVIPNDPILAFLNWLVEDYADEWLTKAMFHYRWHYAADIEKAGSILPRWYATGASDAEIAPLSKMISERQISRLSYVGSNAVTKETIENSFQRFLEAFNAHLQVSNYMFGARPASADFAIYGQLTQLALFDPTPSRIITEKFPRIYAWTEAMEDLSGLPVAEDDSDWLNSEAIGASLVALMQEIASLYLPYLKANAQAVMAGDGVMETELDGRAWSQNPFPYQAKCLAWIGEQYEALSDTDKARLAKAVEGSGLIDALEN
jgi:glutathione S-transferase